MLTTIRWVPGAVTAGQNINLPSWAPKIDVVSSAFIIRPTSQISIADHAAHGHTFSATALTGADLATTQSDHATAGRHTLSDAAAMTHSLSGGNPVVSATATKVDEDTITLNVNTLAGDELVLSYTALGTKLKVA